MLYSGMISNPAAAIYHYQQYLRFDPKAPNADIVNQHINSCKQQLAADVLQLPSSSAAPPSLAPPPNWPGNSTAPAPTSA